MLNVNALNALIEKIVAGWHGWKHGEPLTQEQIAARIAESWRMPPAYAYTQRGNRVQALRTWRLAMRVYRLERQHLTATHHE